MAKSWTLNILCFDTRNRKENYRQTLKLWNRESVFFYLSLTFFLSFSLSLSFSRANVHSHSHLWWEFERMLSGKTRFVYSIHLLFSMRCWMRCVLSIVSTVKHHLTIFLIVCLRFDFIFFIHIFSAFVYTWNRIVKVIAIRTIIYGW